jgi:hypothetical protein
MSALTDDIGFGLSTLVETQRGMTDTEAERFLETGELPNLSQHPHDELSPDVTSVARDDDVVMGEGDARAYLAGISSLVASTFPTQVQHHNDVYHSGVALKYNPKQPREPNTGEWVDTIVGKLPDLPSAPGGKSTPSPAKKSGKPIVPAVIYKKHADGTVVTEATSGDKRLRWDAGKKKFAVEKPNGGDWVETQALTKTAAYAEMKKPDHWVEPGQTGTKVEALSPPQTPESTPAVVEPTAKTTDPAANMRAAYDAGFTVLKEFTAGNVADRVELLELSDGSQVVRKKATPNETTNEVSGLISTIKPKISKSQLVDIKTKLIALRDDFAQSNALDKYDFVIRQIDRLIEEAK